MFNHFLKEIIFNAIEKINNGVGTKINLENTSSVVNDLIDNGLYSPKEQLVYLEGISKAIESAKDNLREHVLKQITEKETILGVEFSVRRQGAKYTYEHDSEWVALKKNADEAQAFFKNKDALLKKREEQMVNAFKQAAQSITSINTDTGEEVPPAIQTNTGEKSLVLKFS